MKAAIALPFVLGGTAAQAHSTVQGTGDFYTGFVSSLAALEHVLAFLALGLLLGQQESKKAQGALPVFWLALMAGAAVAWRMPGVPGVELLNVLSILALGSLIAAALQMPLTACFGLAVAFGLSHGYTNGLAIVLPMNPHQFILGLGVAAMLVTTYGFMASEHLLRRQIHWLEIALRVGGSWIAAVGMLSLAIGWKSVLV